MTTPPRPTDEPDGTALPREVVASAAEEAGAAEAAGNLVDSGDSRDTGDSAAPGPAAPGAPGSAVTAVFRRALRDVLLFLAVLTLVGVAVGWLVAGSAGLWGALLGAAVAAFFSGTTVVVMLRTSEASPTTTAAVVMGSWLAKMVVLVGALLVLRGMDFYDRWVFGAVLLLGVIGSAVLDYRAVNTGRIPYVEPPAR